MIRAMICIGAAVLACVWTAGAGAQEARAAFASNQAAAAIAQSANAPFGGARDGGTLFARSCAACHMADGKGASAAGRYPSLAANPALAAQGYPLTAVVRGLKAMPAFADSLDDEQIAAVVNYVRGGLGNGYKDVVTASDVRALR